MLIKRVYEIDPLACTRCGGQMKVVASIEPPPAFDARIHEVDGFSDDPTASFDELRELTYVDIDTVEATF
jgi:hypothetical protein